MNQIVKQEEKPKQNQASEELNLSIVKETGIFLTQTFQVNEIQHLPTKIKVGFFKLKSLEEQKGYLSKLQRDFKNSMPAVTSIIKSSMALGLTPEFDYWIIPFKNKNNKLIPTFVIKAEGSTKLLENYARKNAKPVSFIKIGIVYKGEINEFSSINGVSEHIHGDNRSNNLEDIDYAFAQYKNKLGETICARLDQAQLFSIRDNSASYKSNTQNSPWTKYTEQMIRAKIIKELVKTVNMSGGLDTDAALKEILESDEQTFNNQGKEDVYEQMATKTQLKQFYKLCKANKKKCEAICKELNIEDVMELSVLNYTALMEALTIDG